MSSEPTLWGFDPEGVGGKVGHDHPLTSHRAATQVQSGSQKAQVLLALRHNPGGLTGYELADWVFNKAGRSISPNQTCTRLLELREVGMVDYKRKFPGGPIVERVTTPGNTGQVHMLTERGTHAVAALVGRGNA